MYQLYMPNRDFYGVKYLSFDYANAMAKMESRMRNETYYVVNTFTGEVLSMYYVGIEIDKESGLLK